MFKMQPKAAAEPVCILYTKNTLRNNGMSVCVCVFEEILIDF